MMRITTLAALIAISLPTSAIADDCSWWQTKMNSANNKINKGGNQSQVKRWEQERDYYARSLEQCNKRNGTHKWVQSISGKREKKTSYAREPLRPVKTDNPQLQQVIKTCNFWIQQYNQNPNDDTQAMKNTACRNADNMALRASEGKQEEQFKPIRSLKECVKPNNVIDRDVKLCMQGSKEPTWIVTTQ